MRLERVLIVNFIPGDRRTKRCHIRMEHIYYWAYRICVRKSSYETSKNSIASLDGKRETEHDVLGNIQVVCSSCGCKEQPVTPLTKASLRFGSSLHHVFTRRTLLITSIFFFHFVLDQDRCSSKETPVNPLTKTFLILGSSLHRSFSTSST